MNNTPQDRSADGVPEVEQKIRIGDTVQRLGEEGPNRPAGTVTGVGNLHASVAFAGLVPTMVRLDALVKVEQARPLNLDRAIAECKRFEEIDRAAVARGESANWWERDAPTAAPTLAGAAPRRARATERESWWMHACGYVELHYDRDGTPAASTCTKCDEIGKWRALYTLGEVR